MRKHTMKFLNDFDFTDEDAVTLLGLSSLMETHAKNIADEFYDRLLQNPETKKYMPSPEAIAERKGTLTKWFMGLFSGQYDNKYFSELNKIGISHVRIGLDSHFVNAGFNFISIAISKIIENELGDDPEKEAIRRAITKILHINLNCLTKSYQEAELNRVFLSQRMESVLVNIAERFTYGLNLVLVLSLVGISTGAVWNFVTDVMHIFDGGDMRHGLVNALGSLIIIWVMIELMETEIEHLKGKAFPAIIFIHVVLVSFIREVLVVSLQHDLKSQAMMTGTALVLGIIYWLVAHADRNNPHKNSH